ncbi:MAG: aminotransferase class I/II-fold pyridoxal phosphate-dependent enzyme [Candidatus Thorarchaeota archaeon]
MTGSTLLDALRSEIERVTLEIVSLVGQRTSLAEEVAKEKARVGAPLVDLAVERHLREVVVKQCMERGFDSNFGLRLLNQLITESIRVQEKSSKPTAPPNAYDMFVKARELERTGREILHLEVGEPDFGPPDFVKKTLSLALGRGRSKYTESAGILPLREKISGILSQRYKREISPEEVMVTVSGRFALYMGIASIVSAGDEVVIVDPSYPAYADIVRAVGGRPIRCPTDMTNKWNLDLSLINDCTNQTTRAIILNSPNNPTGKTLDKSALQRIAEFAEANDIHLISDEVYSGFSFSPHSSVLQFPHCKHVFVHSFSKTYGMTGFRLGYAVSDVDTIRRMTKIQNLQLTCVPEFIQHAGIGALDCDKDAKIYAATIKKRQKVMSKMLVKLPLSFHPPEGAFYIFPRLTEGFTDGQEFAKCLLSETGVCVVPGAAYGSQYSQFFRISVCQNEATLIEAAKRMEEILG